jgi:hypothetical protein
VPPTLARLPGWPGLSPARPAVRQVDDTAADMTTLIDMGVAPEQPEPEPPPADEPA